MPSHAHTPAPPTLDAPVRDVMTHGVVTISADAPLSTAAAALTDHSVHAVLVLSETSCRPLGWVTPGDLLAHTGDGSAHLLVRNVLSEPLETVHPAEDARHAYAVMQRTGAQRLLVQRVGSLAPEGVVSQSDLIALAG